MSVANLRVGVLGAGRLVGGHVLPLLRAVAVACCRCCVLPGWTWWRFLASRWKALMALSGGCFAPLPRPLPLKGGRRVMRRTLLCNDFFVSSRSAAIAVAIQRRWAASTCCGQGGEGTVREALI